MGRSLLIGSFLIGLLVGVALHLVARPGLLILGLIALGCFLMFIGMMFDRRRDWPIAPSILLFFFALCLGLTRAELSEHRTTPDQIDFYQGQIVSLHGIVIETDVRRDNAKYTVSVEDPIETPTGDSIGGVRGKILISVDKYPQYHYGDRLLVEGKLEAPGKIEDFSYDHYLSRYGIYSVLWRPKVDLLESGQGSLFWRAMDLSRSAFLGQIDQLFPEPFASLEAGLLVGARSGVDPGLMAQFNTTGLTHLLAISGFNITILLSALSWALRRLPRKTGFLVSTASVILFVLFAGASPSVVRAGIMGVLGLVALRYGRTQRAWLTALYAAVLMILWNPKILWWDSGFQLSFAAVFGLILVSPRLKPWLQWMPESLGIRESVLMTLSAQILAFPILAIQFGRLSLISPVANLLVAFVIPWAMLFGFLAVAASILFWPLGIALASLSDLFLSYLIGCVFFLSRVPYASIPISTSFSIVASFAYLGIGAFFLAHLLFLRSKKVFS